ncbi:hypothetical protein [Cellulophaga baltica]|uniref:DUF4465 domain-containing protein n=1 Tax=Cellulophaga baltica TaxID=76594 RepID=A0A1G7EJQ9_9FLAO|nr:hypothetical protein [Cellulophaga baltica]SDE63881.1 hypothetical protein SAMN04487992_102365 [Cellulophaga baltica]
MKNINFLTLILFLACFAQSCDNDLEKNESIVPEAVGGLLTVNNQAISYVAGSDGTYTSSGSVYQGDVFTTKIDVYKSFNTVDAVTNDALVSNEVLLTSLDIEQNSGATVPYSFNFTYEDLASDLTVEGTALPTTDSTLNIGDFWTLKYVATTSEGTVHENSVITKVAVGTRYAGVYTVVESAYWNSGSNLGGWNDNEVIIESVDATIYRHVGLGTFDDQEYYFTVDSATGVITVLPTDPEGNAVLLNTSPIMTCAGSSAFESLICDNNTNLATPDDVNGEDQLQLTVGYFRGVGATREFYEKLVKKVD